MQDAIDNRLVSLAETVRSVLPAHVDIVALINEFDASVKQEIAEISSLRDSGKAVIPEVAFTTLRDNGFSQKQKELIRQRGCVVIRGSVSESQASEWNQQLEEYLASNLYYEQLNKAIKQGDKERASHPNILDIYWSRSQLEIRQSTALNTVQQHLNALWLIAVSGDGAFNPAQSCTYADRVRIRQPGDEVNGIVPHVDSCSLEAWLNTESIARCYNTLLSGHWQQFNAFDAVNRVSTERKPHLDACGIFRSYQGWIALTPQGADCGTLQLVPSSRCIAWLFLDFVRSSLNNDEQSRPQPGDSFNLDGERHAALIDGLCSIPDVQAGDTVWWHPDVVHAVEHSNSSTTPSSVVYLGSAPECQRNRDYLQKQLHAFKEGSSPPDFPRTHLETQYADRGVTGHLSELGAQQMGC